MSVGIEPMGEMVLLEMENAPEKTESGLLLPEEAREKMNVGNGKVQQEKMVQNQLHTFLLLFTVHITTYTHKGNNTRHT